MKVFNSGTTRLLDASEAQRESDHDGVYECNRGKVELIRKDTTGLGLEKPVAEITFKYKDTCERSLKREVCDIEIAEIKALEIIYEKRMNIVSVIST